MIHVLDFNDKIIDFLSTDDPSLVRAIHKRNVNDNSEMLELLISSERAEKFRERHRVIIRDSNKQWREFIINWVQDTMDGYTEIECIASYLADITTAKPYAPGKFEKKTTSEALKDVLSDTGWEVSEQTEYDGLRTTSWTSYQTRYEVLKQLCTTYKMVLDFYIELSSNTVKGRYVVLKKKNSLFKGKEIEYGKDLVGLTRKIDMSEIKTALIAVGPENDKGKRLELVVTDDEAQSQFNLPTRYIWGIYEPQSDDQNMNETRLRSLAKTELNKRKSAVMSYEITSTDLEVTYPHEIISIGDTVRVKHRDFNPPLYVEAEVIAEEYNIISENSTYTFGQPKEFKKSELREEFNKRLNLIHQKLNDNISNINTIVKDVVDGELEYFERKIHKSDTPPENPVNDTLWYDTSNPDVAVLRRFWNGRWIEATPNDVEKLGGITREKALFSELNNTFINLSIQHARLLSEATELLNSEYLVDNDLKADLQASLNAVIDFYNQIKNNLESMTPETATIGRLVDTQALFLEYRKKLQDVYTDVEDVKISISDRFKLLQSQYTDEKYKEALEIIATKFGLTVNEDLQLVGEPNVVKSAIEAARES
ncbi:TPA: phage tail protein, partial [Staphylococcus aureus]|nr:phage tail protein [Staphylococcus aureus]